VWRLGGSRSSGLSLEERKKKKKRLSLRLQSKVGYDTDGIA